MVREPKDHPDQETLYAFAVEELPEQRRRHLAEHLRTCAVCRTDLKMARSFASVGADADLGDRSSALRSSFARRLAAANPAVGGRARRWMRPAARLLIAASVVFLAVGFQQLLTTDDDSGSSPPVLRGATNELPISIESRPEGWHVRWTPPPSETDEVPDAASVQILDRSGNIVRELTVSAGSVVIPREGMPADASGPLVLRVTIRRASGIVLESALRALTTP